jgi:tetratricopeptide (TPR) repeat protein
MNRLGPRVSDAPVGDLDQAIAYATRAIELSPMSQDTFICLHYIAVAHLFSSRFEEALDWARPSIEVNDGLVVAYTTVANACARLVRPAEARAAIEMALKLRPDLTVASIASGNPMRFPERLEIWISGLRKAGLPEGQRGGKG